MKPRTKMQRLVVECSQKLRPITEHQIQYAKSLYDGKMYVTKRYAVCFECGHRFDTEKDLRLSTKAIKCPCCGRKITNTSNKVQKWNDLKILAITDRYKDMQVIRFFKVLKHYMLGYHASYSVNEYIQNWIAPKGEITQLSVTPVYFFGETYWQYGGSMEVRSANFYDKNKYLPIADAIYPRLKLTTMVKRNGYAPVPSENQAKVIKAILTDNYAETLIKTRQFWLIPYCFEDNWNRNQVQYYWKSIKLCIRNRYIITDPSMYFDYLELLQRFKRDLLSPKYACPTNLKEAHDHYVKKKKDKDRRDKLKRLKAEIDEADKVYQVEKKPFFDLCFKTKTIEVKPLASVKEFYEEGDELEHCVFAAGYHYRKESLVLSARVHGKRMETVEVSLSNLSINQSRGVHNKPTKYHDSIVNLVQRNMPKIAKRLNLAVHEDR